MTGPNVNTAYEEIKLSPETKIITQEKIGRMFHKETYVEMLYYVLTIAAFSATESRLGKLAKGPLKKKRDNTKMKTGAICYNSLLKYSPLVDGPNLKI